MNGKSRKVIANQLKAYASKINLDKIIAQNDTPVLILDKKIVKDQYNYLQQALPFIKFYYAMKSQSHPDVIEAVKSCNGYFDVATSNEVKQVMEQNISMNRCMQTNPIKKPADIDFAYQAGIKTFVVDNIDEIKKFIGRPKDIKLLIRLSYPNTESTVNLSYKFGISPDKAETLVSFALENQINVDGFCMHVGSQVLSVNPYKVAISTTLNLIDSLESKLKIKFNTIDIGGGYPVSYGHQPITPIEDIITIIKSLLEPVKDRFTIIAEPGRFVSAPAMILVSKVVGKADRYNQPWYYIDDGLYGSYADFAYEDVHPAFITYKELQNDNLPTIPSFIAGPTCDSIDVVAHDYQLPELEIDDLIITPTMGAYTTVIASTFNGIPKTKVVVIDSE